MLRRGVALVGKGFWSETVAKVISVRGAPATIVSGGGDIAQIAAARPAVVVVGPPLDDIQILATTSSRKRSPRS